MSAHCPQIALGSGRRRGLRPHQHKATTPPTQGYDPTNTRLQPHQHRTGNSKMLPPSHPQPPETHPQLFAIEDGRLKTPHASLDLLAALARAVQGVETPGYCRGGHVSGNIRGAGPMSEDVEGDIVTQMEEEIPSWTAMPWNEALHGP